jgi:hypothetical protein
VRSGRRAGARQPARPRRGPAAARSARTATAARTRAAPRSARAARRGARPRRARAWLRARAPPLTGRPRGRGPQRRPVRAGASARAPQVGSLSIDEDPRIASMPSSLLCQPRCMRSSSTAAARSACEAHIWAVASEISAGKPKRDPLQAGQSASGSPAAASRTGERSRSNGPNDSCTTSWMAPRPIGSHSMTSGRRT